MHVAKPNTVRRTDGPHSVDRNPEIRTAGMASALSDGSARACVEPELQPNGRPETPEYLRLYRLSSQEAGHKFHMWNMIVDESGLAEKLTHGLQHHDDLSVNVLRRVCLIFVGRLALW